MFVNFYRLVWLELLNGDIGFDILILCYLLKFLEVEIIFIVLFIVILILSEIIVKDLKIFKYKGFGDFFLGDNNRRFRIFICVVSIILITVLFVRIVFIIFVLVSNLEFIRWLVCGISMLIFCFFNLNVLSIGSCL